MRIGGLKLGWLRRRLWLVLICVAVVTGVAAVFAQPGSSSYTSESVLLVRSGATTNTPGNANEANRLAITYAELISQDSQVLQRVSQTLDTPPADIEDNVEVINSPNTGILRIEYTEDSADEAINGARAFADALAGPEPASTNFNGLALSSLPDSASSNSTVGTSLATAAVLGLGIGIALSVVWERLHVRIDRGDDLADTVDCPVSDLEELSNEAIAALAHRWSSLSRSQPAKVALVAATEGRQVFVESTARVFNRVLESDLSHADAPMLLLPAGMPGTAEVGESVVQNADVVVLVVPERVEASRVREVVASLGDFGAKPQWALFASGKVVRQTVKRDVAEAESPAEPASAEPND
jgi:capsular polysaccharide biosynthesis protein